MRLIADPLQQTQRAGIDRQLQRQRAARPIDFLVFLGQPDDRQIVEPKSLQLLARRRELPFAAVDNDQIRQANERKRARLTGVR